MTAAPPEWLVSSRAASPIGTMRLITDEAGRLRWLDFEDQAERMGVLLRRRYGAMATADGAAPRGVTDALGRYFTGELEALSEIAWAAAGTDFQQTVWHALAGVPVGETTTYAALAARIGRPTAVRATGFANGSNPIGLVVPCHRVIGSNGSLTGYGGGLERKRWLLRHEGVEI